MAYSLRDLSKLDDSSPETTTEKTDETQCPNMILITKDIDAEALESVAPALLTCELHQKPATMVLNSRGGQLGPTWAIIDIMETVCIPITTIAIGDVCSAAAALFITGDYRIMCPNSATMFHHYSGEATGNYNELVAERENQDRIYQQVLRHIKRHSKYKTNKEILKHIICDTDRWFSPKQMIEHGMCDAIMSRKPTKKQKEKGKDVKSKDKADSSKTRRKKATPMPEL